MNTQRTSRPIVLPGGRTTLELAGEGRPLLYLHGLSSSPEAALASAPPGHRVASPWQRGHGDHDWSTEPSAYALSGFVADALAVLDELGWERAAVGGTSMGAAVALRLALDHPERVERLFLAGPAFSEVPNPELSLMVEMADHLEGDEMAPCIERLLAWQRRRGVPPEMSVAVEGLAVHRPGPLAAALRVVSTWVALGADDDLGRLPSTAVVGWPDDPIHPLDLARRMAEATGGRLATVSGLVEVLADPGCIRRAWPTDGNGAPEGTGTIRGGDDGRDDAVRD
ncbi:MAG TPA: alpha/beta hydrolase [Actinobacteria bacterium]|nr:alpha/beta hydrolase [Actinomycetota bacterium]